MTIFLNLGLLIVGTMATLSAFGGKTWHEGSEPVIQRITARGWLSLICLSLALMLGTAKEFFSRYESLRSQQKSENVAAKTKAEADQRQSELQNRLVAAQGQLALANERLESLRLGNKLTENRLNDTKDALADVRLTLASTRNALDRQSEANLLTALGNGDQQVVNDELFLKISLLESCTSQLEMRFVLWTDGPVPEIIPVTFPRFEQPLFYRNTKPSSDIKIIGGREISPNQSVEQYTFLISRTRSSKDYRSTGNLINEVQKPTFRPFKIQLTWLKSDAHDLQGQQNCSSALETLLNHNDNSGRLVLNSKGKGQEGLGIGFALRKAGVVRISGGWELSFAVDPLPEVWIRDPYSENADELLVPLMRVLGGQNKP